MNLKKYIFSLCLFGMTIPAWADDVTVEKFTLSPGETKDVGIVMNNSKAYQGFQFTLTLPEGVTIYEDPDDGSLWWETTERIQWKQGKQTKEFTTTIDKNANNSYFVLSYNIEGKTVTGESGTPVIYVTLTASDQISTVDNKCVVKDLVLSLDGNPENCVYVDETDSDCSLLINATINAAGYGSFAWPRALDFSDTGATVFIAEKNENGYVTLNSVDDGRIPANTGVILRGEGGTVHPQTISDEPAIGTNILCSTADAPLAVGQSHAVYVLSGINGQPGFSPVKVGVTVPQYKAYLQGNGTNSASFGLIEVEGGQTTAIHAAGQDANDGADIYTVGGVKVEKASRKGVYVRNGKKIVVK